MSTASTLQLLTSAQARFDAARELSALQAILGHGFVVQVAAALPEGWGPWRGAQVPALQQRLQAVVEPLNQPGLLNRWLKEPDDAALAQWVADRLDLPVPARVSLRRHARQGLDRLPMADGSVQQQSWRRYRFESAHRLPHVPPGHKCGRMHGHGFEALVRAVNTPPEALDAAWAPLHHQLHRACLNHIPGLDNPTSERLASWLWSQLQPALPGLCGVTVYETASCGAHVDGGLHRIWKDFSFDSATRLRHAPAGDAWTGLHGHTYTLRLHLRAALDERLGWAVDFGDVKQAFRPVFDAIDHRSLDDLAGLADGDCGSLARWIHEQAQPLLPALYRVDLYETPGNGCLLVPPGDEQPWLPVSEA
ncbi:MAG: 6-carboxytetrahydropterin synthase [Rubrivivax sp.]|nr:6-carboxytetrahydropterin synthase [Rubrivivax sp.]